MKRYEISWMREFECSGGNCPQSCCRGWVIPLEEEDIERFKAEKGRLYMALFIATGGWTKQFFNSDSGSCPFWGKDGLCRMQKEKGHEFIPWTCQSFPRFYRNFGPFEEACLDLSCIGAAGLFIRHMGKLDVIECEGDPVTEPCTTNDDTAYLDMLTRLRTEMTDEVSRGLTKELADAMFSFAAYLQDEFATKKDISYDDISFERFISNHHGSASVFAGDHSFPLPPDVLKHLIDSPLFHPRLRWVNPDLYRMLAGARKMIRRFTKHSKWNEAVADDFRKHKILLPVIQAYLSYHLYQYFMRSFETYSFRRQVAITLIHTNMILVLAMAHVFENPEKELTGDDLAGIIAAYNRRAFFSDSIQDSMYRIFEDGLKFTPDPS